MELESVTEAELRKLLATLNRLAEELVSIVKVAGAALEAEFAAAQARRRGAR